MTSTIFYDTGIRKERIYGKGRFIWSLPVCNFAEGFNGKMVYVYYVSSYRWTYTV